LTAFCCFSFIELSILPNSFKVNQTTSQNS
jgi:hypothetical protein